MRLMMFRRTDDIHCETKVKWYLYIYIFNRSELSWKVRFTSVIVSLDDDAFRGMKIWTIIVVARWEARYNLAAALNNLFFFLILTNEIWNSVVAGAIVRNMRTKSSSLIERPTIIISSNYESNKFDTVSNIPCCRLKVRLFYSLVIYFFFLIVICFVLFFLDCS